MTPREFEESVATYFEADGYVVELSSYTSDWGVDVFANKDAERLAIQAKMYGGTTRYVNRECIMQLYGAAAYFDCTGAVLATDGEVMPDAHEVADKLGVRVLDAGRTHHQVLRPRPAHVRSTARHHDGDVRIEDDPSGDARVVLSVSA